MKIVFSILMLFVFATNSFAGTIAVKNARRKNDPRVIDIRKMGPHGKYHFRICTDNRLKDCKLIVYRGFTEEELQKKAKEELKAFNTEVALLAGGAIATGGATVYIFATGIPALLTSAGALTAAGKVVVLLGGAAGAKLVNELEKTFGRSPLEHYKAIDLLSPTSEVLEVDDLDAVHDLLYDLLKEIQTDSWRK